MENLDSGSELGRRCLEEILYGGILLQHPVNMLFRFRHAGSVYTF